MNSVKTYLTKSVNYLENFVSNSDEEEEIKDELTEVIWELRKALILVFEEETKSKTKIYKKAEHSCPHCKNRFYQIKAFVMGGDLEGESQCPRCKGVLHWRFLDGFEISS